MSSSLSALQRTYKLARSSVTLQFSPVSEICKILTLNASKFNRVVKIFVAGRSSVLQDKLKESTERKDDKIVLTLEEDVALEVIHQFLTFIYSGRLKDTRKDSASADPLWVELLPELVQLALKVGNLIT